MQKDAIILRSLRTHASGLPKDMVHVLEELEKLRIKLAPGQLPTTQGHLRTYVLVAFSNGMRPFIHRLSSSERPL